MQAAGTRLSAACEAAADSNEPLSLRIDRSSTGDSALGGCHPGAPSLFFELFLVERFTARERGSSNACASFTLPACAAAYNVIA